MMGNLMTIGEAAARLGCHASSLRRWEKRGLVMPLRDYRGWRYYRPQDVERLRDWRAPRATGATPSDREGVRVVAVSGGRPGAHGPEVTTAASLDRVTASPSAVTDDAVLVIREEGHQVHLHGEPLSLAPRALKVLLLLARQVVSKDGGWVTREAIYSILWPSDANPEVYERQIDDAVKELRHALNTAEPGSGRRLIETKPKVGYRLSLSPSEVALF